MRHDLFDKSLFSTINTAKYIWCAMQTVPQILISISANFFILVISSVIEIFDPGEQWSIS